MRTYRRHLPSTLVMNCCMKRMCWVVVQTGSRPLLVGRFPSLIAAPLHGCVRLAVGCGQHLLLLSSNQRRSVSLQHAELASARPQDSTPSM